MDNDQKKHPVNVRITEADAARLREVAEICHVDKSTMARIIVLDYLSNPRPLLTPRVAPPQATAARSSKEGLPRTTASSTALKRLP